MDEQQQLYGIGGWNGPWPYQTNTFQQAALPVQQLSDLHLPDCPTKYILLDQCSYCCPAYCQAANCLSRTAFDNAAYSSEEQRMQQDFSSHCDVSPDPSYTRQSMPDNAGLSSLPRGDAGDPCQEQRWQQPLPSTYPRTGAPSWAEVAFDPNQLPVKQYKVHLQRDSSFLENRQFAHPSNLQYREQARGHARTRPVRTQRNVFQSVQSQNNGAVKLQRDPAYPFYNADDAMNPQAHPSSHSIDQFVQQISFGGHRRPPSQSLSVPTPSSDAYPPASPSIASSRGSRASSRRKGDEMKDLRFRFACLECHSRFPKNEDLRRHIHRSHTAVSGRPHKCPRWECPWAFVNPKDLYRHLETHSDNRQRIPCPFQPCQKTYTRNDNLQRHVNRDHAADSAYVSMSRTTSSHTSYSQPLFD